MKKKAIKWLFKFRKIYLAVLMAVFFLIGFILYLQIYRNMNTEVYKSIEYKYSVTYPKGYAPIISVVGKNDPWVSYVMISNSQKLDTLFTVSVQKLSLEESVDWVTMHTNFKLLKQEDILHLGKYSGKKIYFFDPYSNNNIRTDVVINNGLYSYTITNYSGNLDEILESFKFTK